MKSQHRTKLRTGTRFSLTFYLLLYAATAAGATANDPIQLTASVGAEYDDNIYRFANSEEQDSFPGTDSMEDWYRYFGIQLEAVHAIAEHRFEIQTEIYRHDYDEYQQLDHNGGLARVDWNWRANETLDGLLGYRFSRGLQTFDNKDSIEPDILERHRVRGSLDKRIGNRWLFTPQITAEEFSFSNDESLDKEQIETELHLQYATSRRSRYGVLATYEAASYDRNESRDFTGWSIGPTARWELTPKVVLFANLGYTHRELDNSGAGDDDFDGVTGAVRAQWKPSETVAWNARIFRDLSNLGGEVADYTDRTGITIEPTWEVRPTVRFRAAATYEKRDFVTSSVVDEGREDDYYALELELEVDLGRRLGASIGYRYGNKTSTIDDKEFRTNAVHFGLEFYL